MNKKLKTLLYIFSFAFFLAAAVFLYGRLSSYLPEDNPLQMNTPDIEINNAASGGSDSQPENKIAAPDFEVSDGDGNKVKLSDFFGKPIVINFWASWCPPCKAEMPDFDKVYAELKDEVIFMMIDLVDGQRETIGTGKKYVEKEGYSFPVYYDDEQDAANTYGISSIPATLFIDGDGFIITGAQGAINEEILRKGIGMIIENKNAESVYRSVSAIEAREIMASSDEFILLDVRTEDEYKEKRIDGAILIPDYDIANRAESELPDKEALILVYCRSGRRSENAAKELAGMGYVNVYDFGGILDWSYETVSG